MRNVRITAVLCTGLLAAITQPSLADDSVREQRLDARGDRSRNGWMTGATASTPGWMRGLTGPRQLVMRLPLRARPEGRPDQ